MQTITIGADEQQTITIVQDDRITITATPKSGYHIDNATESDGRFIEEFVVSDNKQYSFTSNTLVFYIHAYNGTISNGTYHSTITNTDIAINVANGGYQRIEIGYGGSYSFRFEENPNCTTTQNDYSGTDVSQVSDIYCNGVVVTYSFNLSFSNGNVTGWVDDYQGNRTPYSLTGGGGQSIQVEKAGSYYFEFTPQQNYYATTQTIYRGSNVQSQPSDISFSARMKPRVIVTAYNGRATGTLYDEDGNVTGTINVSNSSGIAYYVEPNGGYDIQYSWDTDTYYYHGTYQYSVRNVTTDHTYSFTASAYKYIYITIPTGVSYVTLSGDLSGSYSADTTIKTEQGLSVSWTTQAETGYIVTSGGTGTNVSTNNDITISPQVLNVGIPSAWNIWSPSVHQPNNVNESVWKSTMAVKNVAFTNTTFYVNNNAITVPQNASGFTGFTFANLGCQYIETELATTAPSTTEINGNIYLVDKAYSNVYPSVASNYPYRVYFIRAKLRTYMSDALPTSSSIRVNIQFGLHQGYYLVDNGTALTFAKANRNINAGSLNAIVDTSTNSVQIVFNTKSSYPSTDGTYLYLTVIAKNW